MRGKTYRKREHHNMTGTRLYYIWCNMRFRCNSPRKPDYKYYGGRGVSVCDEWNESFVSFMNWAYENGYEENLTLDRIDVDGNYGPNNCRWVTMLTQANNKKNNVYIALDGKTMSAADWGREAGVNGHLIEERIRKGFPPRKAVYAGDLRHYRKNDNLGIKVINIPNKQVFSSMSNAGDYYHFSSGLMTYKCKRKKDWIKYDDYKMENGLTDEQIERQFVFVK